MANDYPNSVTVRTPGTELARSILSRLFRNFDGSMRIRLWDGSEMRVGRDQPEFSLIFRSSKAFQDMLLSHHPLRVVESYFRGLIDVEGDFYSALKLRHYFSSLRLSLADKASFVARAMMIGADSSETGGSRRWARKARQLLGLGATREINRDAISFHYDVSNDFYALWLDEQMIYSCAYYEDADQTLEQAQHAKLDMICRKLRLAPGERMLDIGCGWGALVCWAAEHYGVQAHGITLSRNQYEQALRAIRQRGLEGRVTVELRDYRDLEGKEVYDKVSSIGMFEHVGLKNLPAYFAVVHRMLKPGGLFLNHGITSAEGGWKKSDTTEFINRYVFPDAELESLSRVQLVMEDAQFEIHDVENLRLHYALTLRAWVSRLEQRREEALRHVPDSVFRIWRFYMASCAQQFEEGNTGIYQILASRRTPFDTPVPLTRRDLYPGQTG